MLAKFTRKIQEKLGLTKSETGIILFLSFGLLLGGSVKIFHLDKATQKYDFAESDAFFAAASSKIDSILAYEEDSLDNSASRTVGAKKTLDAPVNINAATVDELTALPGVGKVTAQKIVDYRTSYGKFSTVDDLMKVKGIGKKKFEKLKPYVRTE